MTYEEQNEVEEAPEVAVGLSDLVGDDNGTAPQTEASLFEQLRRQRSEAAANKETFIPIPGFDREPPIMMAKYRVLDGDEVNKIGRKVQGETRDSWQRQILATIDLLITACVGMYVDLRDGDKPQQMTRNGMPIIGYTVDLAGALGFEAGAAREVVAGVFVNNEIAMLQHGVRLNLWMGNTARKIDQDIFSGEF